MQNNKELTLIDRDNNSNYIIKRFLRLFNSKAGSQNIITHYFRYYFTLKISEFYIKQTQSSTTFAQR